jgi:short-chain Z-isoprenyl diphosphate synthase
VQDAASVAGMGLRGTAYGWYARRLRAQLRGGPLPRHVAIIIDGNRRWARRAGLAHVSLGHRHGVEHIERVLGWCAEIGINEVTVFVLSLDNLRKRAGDEVDYLVSLAEPALERLTRSGNPWRIHLAGRVDTLPAPMALALKQAAEATYDRPRHLTLAIGYDGRAEVVDAVRSLIEAEAAVGTLTAELADRLRVDDITSHLYVPEIPAPDLVIRTSGERRLSGFLMWQSVRSELFFSDVYWPGFRYLDFLRILRTFVTRQRLDR